ncbi:MAG TPA: glycoside hydrolase family 88 protein, partial [Bacteroidales bacterium]|nr:glycoside hydrolase family 88 protein [Bacteroidales bacterium]HPJ59688.1 glycoside hydrolase family 88 protein [Bacteroidales bacterium]
DISAVLTRLLNFLDESTPPKMIDRQTNTEITDLTKLTPDATFAPGVFRLVSYEWGVAYGAMLLAGEVTGDKKYTEYTTKRIGLIGSVAKFFKSQQTTQQQGRGGNPVRSVLDPRALDDAGSMCAAMIKTYNVSRNQDLRPLIDNYINYISTKQQRLSDGTLSRNRPLANALWLDDLYMSVPALAQMGKLTGERKYFDDACKQVLQFSQRMFNNDKGLYMHGWIEGMEPHPEFYWGRCNGWAILTMCELLDVLPDNHPSKKAVLEQYRAHVRGLAALQDGTGFWHQLLDRNDSYLETSATAIFTYCIAHGINSGWLDAQAYGPAAVLGWNAVTTKVNEKGEVEGTCVGTGMAFDPAFYYHRPVNVAAAHGYGPVIMAGAEMIKLAKGWQITINDSAVMFYPVGADPRSFR